MAQKFANGFIYEVAEHADMRFNGINSYADTLGHVYGDGALMWFNNDHTTDDGKTYKAGLYRYDLALHDWIEAVSRDVTKIVGEAIDIEPIVELESNIWLNEDNYRLTGAELRANDMLDEDNNIRLEYLKCHGDLTPPTGGDLQFIYDNCRFYCKDGELYIENEEYGILLRVPVISESQSQQVAQFVSRTFVGGNTGRPLYMSLYVYWDKDTDKVTQYKMSTTMSNMQFFRLWVTNIVIGDENKNIRITLLDRRTKVISSVYEAHRDVDIASCRYVDEKVAEGGGGGSVGTITNAQIDVLFK